MKKLHLVIAAILLLCLAPMPYGYYALVRFAAMVAFAVMAYRYWEKKQSALAITFGTLALLFQPFVKIALGRTVWNVVDVMVAALLIILWLRGRRESNWHKD